MDFELAGLDLHSRYKLLCALVVPRPIAFVSTRGANGVDNAAPISFFNLVGDDPAAVVLSVDRRTDGTVKDSARNILDTREFVVNMVDEPLLGPMHHASDSFDSGVSEFDMCGLTRVPSRIVAPPRIGESPAAIECRLHSHVAFPKRDLFIGEGLWLHVRDGVVDPQTLRVDGARYAPIGRLYANLYARSSDRIALEDNAYLRDLRERGRA
jgi:flavin reductase (DIM6/NTAB) family NADH-FMN oxidoreductase RutF